MRSLESTKIQHSKVMYLLLMGRRTYTVELDFLLEMDKEW